MLSANIVTVQLKPVNSLNKVCGTLTIAVESSAQNAVLLSRPDDLGEHSHQVIVNGILLVLLWFLSVAKGID